MKATLIYLAVPHLFNYLSSIRSALALARFLNIIFKSQVSECNIALNFSKKKKKYFEHCSRIPPINPV